LHNKFLILKSFEKKFVKKSRFLVWDPDFFVQDPPQTKNRFSFKTIFTFCLVVVVVVLVVGKPLIKLASISADS
jgi:hypothetical protein